MTADRIPALLEPIQNRLNAATPGPWHQGRDSNRWENSTEVYSEREVSATSRDICTSIARPEDAELIAAAPTDQARLLAAVQAVLAVADRWEEDFPHKAWQVRTALIRALEGETA